MPDMIGAVLQGAKAIVEQNSMQANFLSAILAKCGIVKVRSNSMTSKQSRSFFMLANNTTPVTYTSLQLHHDHIFSVSFNGAN